jgi:autotransporter-associated beta strand protein
MFWAVLCAASTSVAIGQIPAFPGAEGFGAYATGGRGGDVYTVINLNSSGPGSLRYGVETAPAQGRTIVFAVSGYIPISNNSDTGDKTVRIVQNKVTIAGQTAPGDGIGLKDGRILVTGNNVVLRHLRIRHGKYGGAGDCLNLESSADNTILDHLSLMFSTDENISFFNSSLDNFTMQYSTSSWGMERHNAGGLWDLQHGTCHHSLWADHRTRNPKARPSGLLEWINNVTFHWRSEGFIMGDSQTPINWFANVRGCYFLSIPDYEFGLDNQAISKARVADNGLPNFHLYLDNCLTDANGDGLLNGTDQGYGIVAGVPFPAGGTTPGTVSYDQSPTPFPGATGAATVVIDDPLTAYKKVISSAGALRLDATYPGPLRDELDSLLVNSVESQESILVAKDTPRPEYPDDPPSNGEAQLAAPPYNISNGGFGTLNSTTAPTDSDGDGMPDFWEATLGSNVAVDDHNNPVPAGAYIPNVPAGYTLLEEYLYFMAIPHAVLNKSTVGSTNRLTVDLRRYTSGFNMTPVNFTFSNVNNGSVALQPDGCTAVFTPTIGFTGRARFDFTVTDGDGSAWTQTLAVLVSGITEPRNLKWLGDGSANLWNSSALNWLEGSSPVAFANGDNVRFDDTGSSSPSINLASTLIASSVTVDASQNYTFGGSGALSGSGPLTKSGSGTLTINTTNGNFSGDVTLTGGTLTLATAGSKLNTGNLTLGGGAVFNMPPSSPAYFYPGTVTVLGDQSGTLYSPGLGNGFNGNLISGDANSILYISSGVSFAGSTSAQFDNFSGTINILPGATLRFSPNTSGNTYCSVVPAFVIDGTLRPRNAGNTVQLGAFTGSGTLSGPQSNAGAGGTLYVIGGNNTSATFSGVISSNSAVSGSAVSLKKIGAGTLTLNWASTYTGGSTVTAGTLRVNNSTGTGTGTGSLEISANATLTGTGIIGSATTVDDFAILAPGDPSGTLTFENNLTLNDNSILQFALGSNSDSVVVNGNLHLTGQLHVTSTAGFGPGIYPLFTCSGSHDLGNLTLASALTGYFYRFDTNTIGVVKLVVSPPTPPVISGAGSIGGNFSFSGSGGTPHDIYYVLTSTNLATPATNWMRILTNQFDSSGNFSVTNQPVTNLHSFYRLQLSLP